MKGKKGIQNSIISNNVGFVELNQPKDKKKRNPFLIIFPILIFVLFSGICFGGYYYYKNYMVESTQSVFYSYVQKIDFDMFLDEVLYSQIAQNNSTMVHNTNASLSIKSKLNREEDEDIHNKLMYNFDIFSNPQNEEKSIKLAVDYSDNNLFKMDGVEKDKYFALICPEILDETVAWEKENTAYVMSKVSNTRNKFDYNKVYELFEYQRADIDSNYKNELINKVIKTISKNTKKTNYEPKPNVTYTDENGKEVEAIGYRLHLNKDESNKVFYEVVKNIKDDKDLLKRITQDDDSLTSSDDIDTSNAVYKILESIITEKKMDVSSTKLEKILETKLIEIENNQNDYETSMSVYVVDEVVKIFIFDNGTDYVKCEFLDASSMKITYLSEEMPNYIDGTLKTINSNFKEGLVFLDKALEGEYIAPAEAEEDDNNDENQDVQPGNLRSITVVDSGQSQEDSEEQPQNSNESTNNGQDVENPVNASEQPVENHNSNSDTITQTSINTGDGGTISIGEQGDVTYRNAPQELRLAINESALSKEDIIEDANIGEIEFSTNDDSDDLREELHDIDNVEDEFDGDLTDTTLYDSTENELNANSSQANGFTLLIKKSNSKNNSLEIEYDEINNSQISSKYIIQMNIDGTAESTEIKNDIAINYYDNSGQKLINLKYTTKYGENTVEIPDIENNSLKIDELEEEQFDDAMAQMRGFILKYIKLKKNQWEIITSRNG